jgi:hypothetical protein
VRPLRIDPLQPLRIPAGWRIVINNLCESDPLTVNAPDDTRWEYLDEDLFSAKHDHYQVAVDVGWYPAMNPDGSYRALLVASDDWDKPLDTLVTRSLQDVVLWLEERMDNPRVLHRQKKCELDQ